MFGKVMPEEDVNLNDLFFLNSSGGWVAGEFETILHKTETGAGHGKSSEEIKKEDFLG